VSAHRFAEGKRFRRITGPQNPVDLKRLPVIVRAVNRNLNLLLASALLLNSAAVGF